MFKWVKRKAQNSAIVGREVSASKFIPYKAHWDSNTLITKQGELLAVIKVGGFTFETADDEDLDAKKNIRNTLYKSFDSGKYAIWFHTIRRKLSASIDGEFDDPFCDYVNKRWIESHTGQDSFANELYISVLLRPDTIGYAGKINEFFKKHTGDREQEKLQMSRELREVTNRIVGSLGEYRCKLLGTNKTPKGSFCEIMGFLSLLVNCGETQPIHVPNRDISKYLPYRRLYVSHSQKVIETRTSEGKRRFCAMLAVKQYPPKTYAGMLDSFLQMPFELCISQAFLAENTQDAVRTMSRHQQRMASVEDKAISQMAELTNAMDMATGGAIGFGEHCMTLTVYEDNIEQLEESINFCYGELINIGLVPVRESMTLLASFWGQLPGNDGYFARQSKINTLNLASLVSLHNYPNGSATDNHWGPAVTLIDTTSGTPFYFNFHMRDIGHTSLVGPTGAGKTVLMNFLTAQATKFGGRVFLFDKDRGSEIFVRAIGGIYTILEPREKCGFNPLQLEDNSENKTFLAEWVKTMSKMTMESAEITPEESERIQESIEGNFKLDKKDRRLNSIAPFLGFVVPGSLSSRIKQWCGEGVYAGIFDNAEDSLDFNKARVFGFEMGNLLADGTSLPPVLQYLFHRIRISLDGTPTIVVLDEAWALIDNEVFRYQIKDWLKVLRKLNAMVIFATQSVEDLSKSEISDTLVQQTVTQIFLANNKATEEYKKTFMLSNREFQIVKQTDPKSHYFLVKQGEDKVVGRVDLGEMMEVIHVLSGRTHTVGLLDEIRERVGDDPKEWLPIFMEEVEKIA